MLFVGSSKNFWDYSDFKLSNAENDGAPRNRNMHLGTKLRKYKLIHKLSAKNI